ncbi:porin [Roseinatronobacter sp. NSM]|uniref:porin n=1 Tax=Roseinatronobacter sp. NSM TaxID=3457785 RepID=UPI0040362A64
MKKLLLASTALVMTAGAAAAQVNMSGAARMGIAYDNGIEARNAAGTANQNTAKLQFTSRIRVTFSMSGETDSGLAFGASIRGDQFAAGNAGNESMTGGTVFIDGAFGRLTFGDTAGAARAAVGDLYGVGLTGIGDLNEMAYLDRRQSVGAGTGINRRTAVLYQYNVDSFTFYASLGQQRRLDETAVRPGTALFPGTLGAGQRITDELAAIGVKYTIDGFTISAGYEMAKAEFKDTVTPANNAKADANHIIIGAEYAMDNFKVKAIAGRVGGDLGTTLANTAGLRRNQYGLSVSGDFDATTVTAFINRNFETTNYGIGASYDLGGGASLVGGISRRGSNTTTGTDNRTRADMGLNFSF